MEAALRTMRNHPSRGQNIYARSRDALDRVLVLTGDNSRAIRPYVAELPGQGRIGKVATPTDQVKESDYNGMLGENVRAVH